MKVRSQRPVMIDQTVRRDVDIDDVMQPSVMITRFTQLKQFVKVPICTCIPVICLFLLLQQHLYRYVSLPLMFVLDMMVSHCIYLLWYGIFMSLPLGLDRHWIHYLSVILSVCRIVRTAVKLTLELHRPTTFDYSFLSCIFWCSRKYCDVNMWASAKAYILIACR